MKLQFCIYRNYINEFFFQILTTSNKEHQINSFEEIPKSTRGGLGGTLTTMFRHSCRYPLRTGKQDLLQHSNILRYDDGALGTHITDPSYEGIAATT